MLHLPLSAIIQSEYPYLAKKTNEKAGLKYVKPQRVLKATVCGIINTF